MEKLNLSKNNLRKFGIIMGAAFLVIALFILLKNKNNILPVACVSGGFFISALFIPAMLKPVYIFWMKLDFILSWVNTRLILSILFYAVFTPMGLGMRLFGIDLLDRKIEKRRGSYWRKKDKKQLFALDYERQF
ncbi:MAG: SxtJ family membrane protein [Candidatus Omnitrophica bacterium]|nr:SxtJ family membrane protein [Candidatus Omnitrophota bacterium]